MSVIGTLTAPLRVSRLDRYVLEKTMTPVMAVVGIALVALLMERMVRLMDLLVNQGGPLALILKMLANLVPHYLGLALPLALFIGIMLTATRLSVDSELDAMQAAGVSLARLLRPLLALTAVIFVTMVVLIGWVQPYTRYAYRALIYAAQNSTWDLAIEKGAFFSGIGAYTVLIDDIAENGRRLTGVFVHQRKPDGGSSVMTAIRGEAVRTPNDPTIVLKLEDGRRTEFPAGGGRPSVLTFDRFDLPLDVAMADPFQDRSGERVLTMEELFDQTATPEKFKGNRLMSEIHGRIVRALSVLFLPLLALPLGLASRRNQRGAGIVVGVVLLALYYALLQFGEVAVDRNRLSPWVAFWLPWGVMMALGVWAFLAVSKRPRDNVISIAFDGFGRGVSAALAALRGAWKPAR